MGNCPQKACTEGVYLNPLVGQRDTNRLLRCSGSSNIDHDYVRLCSGKIDRETFDSVYAFCKASGICMVIGQTFHVVLQGVKTCRRKDPGLAQMVELRFFGGLTVEETSKVLEVSPRKVKLDWRVAKAWLKREIDKKNDS